MEPAKPSSRGDPSVTGVGPGAKPKIKVKKPEATVGEAEFLASLASWYIP